MLSFLSTKLHAYESLYKRHRNQAAATAFAHFYPVSGDFDKPFQTIASQTSDGLAAWQFQQDRFKQKYPHTQVPKLQNYLNYTFRRLLELEQASASSFFCVSDDDDWVTFNTGLQNIHGADLLAVFQRY